MSTEFLSAVQARRTHYSLSKASTIPDHKLISILETAIQHVPSPFNIQSSRVVLLLGKESEKVWDIAKAGFLKTLGDNEGAKKLYSHKMAGYAGGYGTILFFEDTATLDAMAAKQPGVAALFPTWSENSTGMLQFVVWTALATEGIGASLQHTAAFSDEIAENIQREWKLPSPWKSTAMMPFGVPTGEAGVPGRPKTFLPIAYKFKWFT